MFYAVGIENEGFLCQQRLEIADNLLLKFCANLRTYLGQTESSRNLMAPAVSSKMTIFIVKYLSLQRYCFLQI